MQAFTVFSCIAKGSFSLSCQWDKRDEVRPKFLSVARHFFSSCPRKGADNMQHNMCRRNMEALMLIRSILEQPCLDRIAIFFTTFFVPMVFEVWDGWATAGECWGGECVEWGRLALYFGMFLFALSVIAISSKVSAARVDKKLNRMSSKLEDSINQLQEDHERKITTNRISMGDIQRWVANIHRALREQCDIELPSYGVSAGGVGWQFDLPGIPESGVTHTPANPPNMLARLGPWIGRQWSRFRGWFRKWIWA